MHRNYRIIYRILPALFIVFLVLPWLNMRLHLIKDESTENRTMAEKPVLDLTFAENFPHEYDEYWDDNFGFRNNYVLVNSYVNYKFFSRSVVPEKVHVGKGGWLYPVQDESLPVYRGQNQYPAEKLVSFYDEIKKRRDYLKEKGIAYYIFLVPTKASVYPEYVGSKYQAFDLPDSVLARTEQLMDFLKTTDVADNIFYMKDTLMSLKKKHHLYYKNDHHWNSLGAKYAAGFMLEKLQKRFPQLHNFAADEEYELQMLRKNYGDLTAMLGIRSIVKDDYPELIPLDSANLYSKGEKKDYKVPEKFPYPWDYYHYYKTNKDNAPRALIIRDSFTNHLIPFLSRSFKESVYIWDGWKYRLNQPILNNEQPDVLIEIIIENNADHILKYPLRIKKD